MDCVRIFTVCFGDVRSLMAPDEGVIDKKTWLAFLADLEEK